MQETTLMLRPFVYEDAAIILSWCKDRRSFRLWSADRYKDHPASPDDMVKQYEGKSVIPLTMVEGERVVGHIILRRPTEDKTIVRLGFVIVDDSFRGKGYGKKLIQLATNYAKDVLGAKVITLGVFTENISALGCYKSFGFEVVCDDVYTIDGEAWKGVEMKFTI